IRPLEELVQLFRLEDVNPSPAFFDERKLSHVNAEYIRALTTDEFLERSRPFLLHGEATAEVLEPVADLVQTRVRTLTEVEPMVGFLRFDDLVIDDEAWRTGVVKLGDRAAAMLGAAEAQLDALDRWQPAE